MRFVALRATVPTGGRRSLACTPLRPLEAVPRSEPSRRFTSRAPPASGGPCRAPPGETLMIGSARSPRPHEKGGVALMLAGPGVIAAGFALARDAGRRPVASSARWGPAVARHPALEGYAPRREPSRQLGSRPPRPCGPLCRPEVGVPVPARHPLCRGSGATAFSQQLPRGRRSSAFPEALVRL